MHIAMISYWACPLAKLGVATAGGMNVYVLNLANALGSMGHTIDIYTRTHEDEDDLSDAIDERVSVVHIPSRNKNLYDDIGDFAAQVAAESSRRGRKYDILHAHYYYSGLVGLKIRAELNLPLVITFHTLGVMKEKYAGVVDTRRIAAESAIIDSVDVIVASTELEKADLIEWHDVPPDKISVIHPGVEHHLFKPYDQHVAREVIGLPDDEKILLFVGRIDPIKGIHILIDAFSRLLEEASDGLRETKLLVIGGDPENEQFWKTPEGSRIREEIQTKQLDNHVQMIGSRSHAQLAYYYAAADLLVMPSAYETFGFVALEAMACGTCVIASRVGGLQYLVKDRVNGRLFDAGNSDELCAIMRELLLDTGQRERLGKQAAASSYRYCWDKQAERMLAVYRRFL
jgi:D-inositol-3-phosphate glycosyltransferase